MLTTETPPHNFIREELNIDLGVTLPQPRSEEAAAADWGTGPSLVLSCPYMQYSGRTCFALSSTVLSCPTLPHTLQDVQPPDPPPLLHDNITSLKYSIHPVSVVKLNLPWHYAGVKEVSVLPSSRPTKTYTPTQAIPHVTHTFIHQTFLQ